MTDEGPRPAGHTNPRTVLRGLMEHWAFLELLIERIGDSDRMVSESEALQVAEKARLHPGGPKDCPSPEHLLNQVVRAGILIADHSLGDDSGQQYLEVPPEMLAFIRYLVNAPSLESAGVLGTRIDALKACLRDIHAACQKKDDERLILSLNRLPSEISGTRRQLRNDRQAIENMVGQIKSQETDVPLDQRYMRMFSAYDEHLQPMVDLLDPGTAGHFQDIFSYGQDVLQNADHYLHRGGRHGPRAHVGGLRRSLKTLVHQARLTADVCRRELFPLRQAQERSSKLVAAVNYAHSLVRRNGWSAHALCDKLPTWPLGRKGHACIGQELASFMAELADYTPAHVPAPEIVPLEQIPSSRLAESLDDVLVKARQAEDVDDLLGWISEHFDDFSGSETLAAFYHCLFRGGTELKSVSGESQTLTFRDLIITHHPFRVKIQRSISP